MLVTPLLAVSSKIRRAFFAKNADFSAGSDFQIIHLITIHTRDFSA